MNIIKRIGIVLSVVLMTLSGLFGQDIEKEFTLDELIAVGLKNSPHLSAQKMSMDAQKYSYEASRRLMNPELEYSRGKAESYDGLIDRNTEGLAITQPIENPFKRHYRIQVQKNLWQAAEYVYQRSRIEHIFNIKSQFYKILFYSQFKELSRKNLQAIDEILHLIQKRAALGEVKELEAIKLNVESLRAKNELNQAITWEELAKENLNKLLGNTLPINFKVAGSLNFFSINFDEKELIQRAKISQPLLKQKEKELEQAQNTISYLKWHRLPDFKLTGFKERELDGENLGIGISLDIPLWNFRSKEIGEAENLAHQQAQELKALEMDLTTDIKSWVRQLLLSQQTLELFSSGLLTQAEVSLRIADVSYREGEISLIDYLDSQRTYYSIMKDHQEALFNWNMDKAALEKVVGEKIQ